MASADPFPIAQEPQLDKAEKPPTEKKQEPEEEVDHPDFNGTWKITKTENFEEFCEAAGITGMQCTFQKKAERRMVQIINIEERTYTVQMNCQNFERELVYTLGGETPTQYRDQHKSIISARAKWSKDGQDIIVKCKVYPKGVDPDEEPDNYVKQREVRYIEKGKMYEEITIDDETLIRTFRKQK
eukprot:45077_1